MRLRSSRPRLPGEMFINRTFGYAALSTLIPMVLRPRLLRRIEFLEPLRRLNTDLHREGTEATVIILLEGRWYA